MKTLCKPVKKPVQKRRKAASKASPKIYKYLCRWNDIFVKWGWNERSKADKSALRKDIRRDVLGVDIEPSNMNNGQWDVVFFALDLIWENGILVWSPEMAAYAREEGWRRVYIWCIEHAGLDIKGLAEYGAPEEYIAAIARDRFGGVRDWRTLNSGKLQHLFWTIKDRVRKANEAGESLWKPENAAVDAENCPF